MRHPHDPSHASDRGSPTRPGDSPDAATRGAHPHGTHQHGAHQHGGAPHAGHAHGAHAHGDRPGSERRLVGALVLTGGFMLAEVAGGVLSGSLALLADAGHMLADFASLALAWLALRLARRPADARRTFGYRRFEVIAAYTNGLSLFAVALWITVEAIGRLLHPGAVLAGPMLVVAVAGLVVNLLAFGLLHGASADSLNLRGAAVHVLGDLLGSIGAIAAALVILRTGWTPIDPILSVAVALLILRSAWRLVRESGHILLEGAPDGADPARVAAVVRTVDGVLEVHHVHLWSLGGEQPMLTLHVVVAPDAAEQAVLRAVHRALADQLGIEHATVQAERGGCASGPGECFGLPASSRADNA